MTNDQPAASREAWGSRLGFVLAASGSAVGLGNIWRFPYMAGQNGGAAFVLIYLTCVFLVGLAVMMAELAVGRSTGRNPIGAFKRLAPNSAWRAIGVLGVITGFAILSYYSVVAGWMIRYAWLTMTGAFARVEAGETTRIFQDFVANPTATIGLHALFLALTALVVIGGIRRGIERWTLVLMPFLFITLLVLVARALTLEGMTKGLAFYLRPDFSRITFRTFLDALGQAFFSLSLGMGAMITYGSYLLRQENLSRSATTVCATDTLVALLAGLVIFPTLFTVPGVEPAAGPGLVFVVLPALFPHIPGGQFFGSFFFLLLVVAALTSAISLMEVCVAYLIDERAWGRAQACGFVGLVAFVLGIPAALSNGAAPTLTSLPVLRIGFLDLMDTLFGNIGLTIGALGLCLFVGWRWGHGAATQALAEGGSVPWVTTLWFRVVRYLCPVAIGAILIRFIWGLLGMS